MNTSQGKYSDAVREDIDKICQIAAFGVTKNVDMRIRLGGHLVIEILFVCVRLWIQTREKNKRNETKTVKINEPLVERKSTRSLLL